MKAKLLHRGSLLALFLALPPGAQGAAQDFFTTRDFRLDRAQWTNPAYYRNNTVGELRGMGEDPTKYATQGTARADAPVNFSSPYAFTNAWEHYQAWLRDANGGTKHTKDTIPDWKGRWSAGRGSFSGGNAPMSALVALLTPQYQEYFIQDVKAESEARAWWAGAFCLPGGYLSSVTNVQEFIVTPEKTWTHAASIGVNYIRWIYTDGSPHSAEEFHYPKWHGESVGFWDGDSLVVHTNQIKGWLGGLSEFTDELETVERYRRVGDTIQGEITLYDPDVFVKPYHAKLTFRADTETRPELRPTYNTCTDTNGPSPQVYLDERGMLNQRVPGDPLHWDPSDLRPWGTFFNESEQRYRRYLDAGGKPHGSR
jgi:hypothetical protein